MTDPKLPKELFLAVSSNAKKVYLHKGHVRNALGLSWKFPLNRTRVYRVVIAELVDETDRFILPEGGAA